MAEQETLKDHIRQAFATVKYPGDWCLRGSNEGDEPFRVERDFKGKNDWRLLAPEFIDQSPDGLASALCFFSDEAFHFYLPAYMIADIDDRLKGTDPVFYLTHGLDDSSQGERVNPQRYGERTWLDEARYKFSVFSKEEVAAVLAYLRFKRDSDPYDGGLIDEAIHNYWSGRLAELGG